MAQEIEVVRAGPDDAIVASSIMREAAGWLVERGETLWFPEELSPEKLKPSIDAGELYLVKVKGVAAGTVVFQLSDRLYWPDIPEGDAAYMHKLTRRRSAAGKDIGRKVIAWAMDMARQAGMKYLRLDTEAARKRLCAFYESAGFIAHSERQVGRHYVVRYEMRV